MFKAFDCVLHAILLGKIYKSPVLRDFYELLMHYLPRRCQFVQIQDDRSDAQFIRHGVPQGSILVLLLFSVYNDIFYMA
jgi:hypothetical protein